VSYSATILVRYLERLDILEAIHNTATDLEVPRTYAKPAPPFKRARTNVPAAGQENLV
jgi:hypothetical protein